MSPPRRHHHRQAQQHFIDFRKRRSYTLEEKLEIIKELEGGAKQAQVAEAKQIAASTVQNIWSTRDRVLGDYRRVRNHSLRKIPRNPKSCHVTSSTVETRSEFGDIEKSLMQWYTKAKRNGGITGPMLKAKALHISKQFGHYEFKASPAWFSGWLARYGVTLPKVYGSSGSDHQLQPENGISESKSEILSNPLNNGEVGQSSDALVDDDIGIWPVTVTYANEDDQEQGEAEDEEQEIVDPSLFMVQEHEGYSEVSKPIKEIRNGVEVIYRSRGSKGGRYKSYIWKYFREQEEEIDGGSLRFVECAFCNSRVSPKAGRMEKHLISCEFCPSEIREELGLGAPSELKPHHLLQNSMSNEADGELDTDMLDEEGIDEEGSGSPGSQNGAIKMDQTSGNTPPTLKKRRTFHWRRIATYKDIAEAERALGDLSMWSRKHKHRTQQGIKTYYGCKFGRNCPVQMHLLFESRTKRVIMFQTLDDHCHVSKFKKRGLPPAAEKPIRQLYREGVRKPSHIQQALDEDGGDVPPRYQIAYFVDKIRKEDPPSIKVESSETITIPDCGEDFMDNWYDESRNGEDSSEIEIVPFYPDNVGSTGENSTEDAQNWTEVSTPSPTTTANLFKSAIKIPAESQNEEIQKGKNEISIYPAASNPTPPIAGAPNTTAIGITSNAPQAHIFRDETTKDGDIIAPGEQNVKRKVINFIEKNFSNRDFLQIHRELQSLKDAQKYTSLIRLASFTSGFLQTAFLDQQQDSK